MSVRPPRLMPLTLALLGGTALACAHQVNIPESYTPTYTFNPPTSAAGQGISIAIIAPKLGQSATSNMLAQYRKLGVAPPPDFASHPDAAYQAFMDAVDRSLLQYLTASSISVSGPFRSVDEMTFPEKKQADLVLTIDLNVTTDQPGIAVDYSSWDGRVNEVESRGPCSVGGTVDFVIWEPLSLQRMWAKSAEVPRVEADCTLKAGSMGAYNVLLGNAFATLYEPAFKTTLTAAMRYFSPEEIALVKRQAQELRDRKVY